MTFSQKARLFIAIAGQSAAALMVIGSGYYGAKYYTDTASHIRHEFLYGASLLLLYAVGSSLVSALVAASIKSNIRKRYFRALVFPALVLGGCFLVLYFGSLVADFVSRI